jgi:hypothetical protein
MTLTVEDGTARADAESYASVAFATAYHDARGNAAWDELGSDTLREQYLRKATDFMVGAYRERWAGYRVTATQALDWPRYYVPMRDVPWGNGENGGQWVAYWPMDSVPQIVQRACVELALRAIDGELAADLDPPVIEETVGPITTKYAIGARKNTVYQAVEAMLSPLFDGSGSMIPVRRA